MTIQIQCTIKQGNIYVISITVNFIFDFIQQTKYNVNKQLQCNLDWNNKENITSTDTVHTA